MHPQPDAKTSIIKTLAIVGFLVIVTIIVWLGIQGLRALPSSFSSLAAIAETINKYRPTPELTVATEKSIVNSGESFELTWSDMKQAGVFHFSYQCTEGVSLTVRSGEGDLVPIDCTSTLSLPSEVHGLFVSITSERQRFSDVPLVVAFEKEGETERTQTEARITVVNATVPTPDIAVVDTTPATTTVTIVPPPVVEETPTPVVPTTPTPEKPVTPIITPKPTAKPPVVTPVAQIPVSDPRGYTDLKISFEGIGSYKNDVFVPIASYDSDVRGGLKVAVKNIGTKTSDVWSYELTLPNGVTYDASKQAGLRPNETAYLTIGFDFIEDFKNDAAKIKGSVTTANDILTTNNSFSWSVKVTN